MCNYCGCRSFPLIAQLTEEHEAIANAAGRLHRAITRAEADPASALDALLRLLAPHTDAERSVPRLGPHAADRLLGPHHARPAPA